jgi:tRNA-dihydrouridine synthase
MENLANHQLRRAFARTIGGCDEMCSEFMRVPDAILQNGSRRGIVRGVVQKYNPRELMQLAEGFEGDGDGWTLPYMPLGAQIMGSTADILSPVTAELLRRGAPRVDLNLGCPSNVVTGKGAGSSMLRTPELVHECLSAMVAAAASVTPGDGSSPSQQEEAQAPEEEEEGADEECEFDWDTGEPKCAPSEGGEGEGEGQDASSARLASSAAASTSSFSSSYASVSDPSRVVSVKMRTGYADTSLFHDNLAAAQAAGAAFVTLHGRTKIQGYSGRADWNMIAKARGALTLPLVGNGDVTTPTRALELVGVSGCEGVMIGRGAVRDPLIFWRVRAAFGEDLAGTPGAALMGDEARAVARFFYEFSREVEAGCKTTRSRANRLKQVRGL